MNDDSDGMSKPLYLIVPASQLEYFTNKKGVKLAKVKIGTPEEILSLIVGASSHPGQLCTMDISKKGDDSND